MRKLLVFTLLAAASGMSAARAQTASDDPYLWLEDVSSPKAMAWVNAHNARSTAVLEADPRYQQYYNEALEIAQAKDRIPYGSLHRWSDLQFLAGRRPCARHLATHQHRELRQRQSSMGDRA